MLRGVVWGLQAFNNTRHDYEITLEPNSVIEVCEDDERAIPKMQYHVRASSSLKALLCCRDSSQIAHEHQLRMQSSIHE